MGVGEREEYRREKWNQEWLRLVYFGGCRSLGIGCTGRSHRISLSLY